LGSQTHTHMQFLWSTERISCGPSRLWELHFRNEMTCLWNFLYLKFYKLSSNKNENTYATNQWNSWLSWLLQNLWRLRISFRYCRKYFSYEENTKQRKGLAFEAMHAMARLQLFSVFSLQEEHLRPLIFRSDESFWRPITLAARSKAWTVFNRSNAGVVGSNPTQAMDVYVRLFCVCLVLCVGSGLATGWSHRPRSPTDCA
jgi:hypothetical protein